MTRRVLLIVCFRPRTSLIQNRNTVGSSRPVTRDRLKKGGEELAIEILFFRVCSALVISALVTSGKDGNIDKISCVWYSFANHNILSISIAFVGGEP